MFAHNHPISFKFLGSNLKICARCSGIVLGFTLTTIISSIFQPLMFLSLPSYLQISVCLLLAIPVIIDWLSNTLKYSQGTNVKRLTTGLLVGVGVSLIAITQIPFLFKSILILVCAGCIIALGLFLKK